MGAIKKCNLCERLFISRLSLVCLNCESDNNNTKTSMPSDEHNPIKHNKENAVTTSSPEKTTLTKHTNSKKPKLRILQRTVVKKSTRKLYENLLKEKTSAATRQENIIRDSLVLNYTNATTSATEPSLGEMASSVGKLISKTSQTPNHLTQKYISPCSCQGMNQNCFKCSGTGYCEREIITTPSPHKNSLAANLSDLKTHQPKSEVSFASDSRGGIYSIRENGRFTSDPIEDDYDN